MIKLMCISGKEIFVNPAHIQIISELQTTMGNVTSIKMLLPMRSQHPQNQVVVIKGVVTKCYQWQKCEIKKGKKEKKQKKKKKVT